MKRKRGHKKGKPKKKSVISARDETTNVISVNTEDTSEEIDNDGYESRLQVEDNTASTGTDQPLSTASINPDGSIDKFGAGKLKLKLKKTPKPLESQSDTDKSTGGKLDKEKRGLVAETVEDDEKSLSQMKRGILGSLAKKAGSIKIKSSKVFGNVGGESSQKYDPKTSHPKSRYNKQEIDTALMVIQKVMTMDAAKPFNVPVNPEALGIPDYFDVIDTPMDFGTICSNIERGDKYMSSEDVYKDVQYIWENCYKYNNKGDYIIELMRLVKKKFMKSWTGAGLYDEQPKGTNGGDSTLLSQGKVHVKSGQLKPKSHKRHGRRHKNNCLCAICVLKRRKREREHGARITAKDQIGSQEFKQEGTSLVDSPSGEDLSSNMEETMDMTVDADADADAEVEGNSEEMKVEVGEEQQYSPMDGEDEEDEIEIQGKDDGGIQPLADRFGEDPNGQSLGDEKLGLVGQASIQKRDLSLQQAESATPQLEKEKDQEKEQRAKPNEHLLFENSTLPSLCRILFPTNGKSVWGGRHSLVQRHVSAPSTSMHAAINTLMK